MEDMVADDAGAVEGRSRTAATRCAVPTVPVGHSDDRSRLRDKIRRASYLSAPGGADLPCRHFFVSRVRFSHPYNLSHDSIYIQDYYKHTATEKVGFIPS